MRLSSRFLTNTLAAMVCLSLSLTAQVLERSIAIDDGDPATSDTVFGITMDPDGVHAYVAVSGDLPPFTAPQATWPQFNNRAVVQINLLTGMTTAVGQTGDYPEDIALTLDASGQTRHVYVSDSTSGTVTCLTPGLQPVATINLTPCMGGNYASVYPFGIIASQDSTRIWVLGTSCGTLDEIDSDPTSPTFNQVLSSISVPNAFGRLSWLDANRLVVPTTEYFFNPSLGFSDGSETGIAIVDLGNGGSVTSHSLVAFTQFEYPTITEAQLLPSGRLLCGVAYGSSGVVLEVDPATGLITRQADLGIEAGVGLHGIALSPDGETAAITVLSGGEVLLFDVSTFSISTQLITGTSTQPNEVVFTPDGSRIAVTLQALALVQVFSALPSYYSVDLSLDHLPSIGSALPISISGLEAGAYAGLFVASGGGPTQVGPYWILLDPGFNLLLDVFGNAQGVATANLAIPNNVSLTGLEIFAQVGTTDSLGSVRLSNGAKVTILP